MRTDKIVAFRVTAETTGDAKHLLSMPDETVGNGCVIMKVLADWAYDAKYLGTYSRKGG